MRLYLKNSRRLFSVKSSQDLSCIIRGLTYAGVSESSVVIVTKRYSTLVELCTHE